MIRGIALAGLKHVGKSTAATYMETSLHFKAVHVKSVLGEMVAPLLLRLGIPLEELHQRIFGDMIDDPLPMRPELTARRLLQAMGNGFLLELPDPMLVQKLVIDECGPGVPVVVESVRYAREAEWLRANGFKIVRIIRPGLDASADAHLSENDQGFEVDATIFNEGGIGDLQEKIKRVASKFVPQPELFTREPRVVLVNGRPRAGKDSFVDFAVQYIEQRFGWAAEAFSSIDPVREVLRKIEVDVSAKDAADRKLLADLGTALEEHCSFRTIGTMNAIQPTLCSDGTAFVFVREKYMMDNIISLIATREAKVMVPRVRITRLWIVRPGFDAEPASCTADAIDGTEVNYDWLVVNDGDLDGLQKIAVGFVDALLGEKESGYFTSAFDLTSQHRGAYL